MAALDRLLRAPGEDATGWPYRVVAHGAATERTLIFGQREHCPNLAATPPLDSVRLAGTARPAPPRLTNVTRDLGIPIEQPLSREEHEGLLPGHAVGEVLEERRPAQANLKPPEDDPGADRRGGELRGERGEVLAGFWGAGGDVDEPSDVRGEPGLGDYDIASAGLRIRVAARAVGAPKGAVAATAAPSMEN
jgi:hypothetical protein